MIFCYFLNIKSRSLMHRTANATRSDGGRNLIGRRTESDRTPDGIGDEKRVCQKSNKMSCKPKSIDF